MPFISTTAIGRWRAVAALVAALATVPVALAAVAGAAPDPTAPAVDPKAECESVEFGGVYVADVQDGVSRGVCQYIVEGQFYYDSFENGAYVNTSVYRDGATVPTERPVIPELFSIPQGLPLTVFQGAG